MAILIFKQGLDSETGSLAYAEPIFHTPSNTLVISGSDSRTYRLALVDKINTGSIHTTGDFSGSNLLLDGNATIRGNITMGGSGLDFGDASDDNIVFKADISSSIIPDSNNSFNLGSDAQRWNDLYISGAISASGGHFDFDSDSFIDLNAASRFDVDAGGILSLDSTNSITIGTAQDVPINIDATTFDVDASSTLTLDATRFNIGHVGDSPMDVEVSTLNIGASGYLHLSSSATLDVDASGAITINGESTTAISSSGALSIDSETGINIGTTTDKPIDIDSSTLDIDASGAITIDGTSTLSIDVDGATNINTSVGGIEINSEAGSLTLDGHTGVDIDASNSGKVSIDGAGGIDIGVAADVAIDIDSSTLDIDASGAVTVDSTSTISLDGVGNSNFTIDSGNLTINNTTSGDMTLQSAGAIDIDADGGKINIDGSAGIQIGAETDVAIDIDSSTLDIDSSGAITINGESTTAISSSGALSIDSETSINIGTTSDKPVNIDSTTFDVDSTDGIRLKSNNGISLEESGVTVMNVDANQDVTFLREGGSKLDPDVDIVGYLKLGEHGGFIQGALSSSGEISSSADITTSGLNAGNINVGITGDNEIDTDSGNLTIDSAGGTVTIDDNTIITGDLTVNGTRTFTNTATLDVADNIININYGGSSVLAGLYANDVTAPNVLSGSILWNGTTDRWIAGQSGSEQTLLLNNGDSIISGSGTNNQITTFTGTHGVDSSANLTFDGSVLRVTGEQQITDNLSGSKSASFSDLIITDDASIASLTVTDLTDNRIVLAGGGGELQDSSRLTFDETTLYVNGNQNIEGDLSGSLSGSFKNVNVADNLTVDGVVKAEKLNVTSSENILATFQSTDAAAKIVLKDVDGEGARFSYIGSTDTVGIGQSNTHNHLAIHINDNEQVAIGKGHTIPHAVLDVSGSLIVSGTLETTGDFAGVSGSFKALKVTDLGDNRVVFVGPNGELEGDGNLRWNGLGLAVTGEISSTTSGSFADLSVSDDAKIASLAVTDLTSGRVVFTGGGGELVDSGDLTWDGTDLIAAGNMDAQGSGSFRDVKVTDNATIDGVVRAEQLNVTSSENVLATFISTDAAAKIVLKDVDGEGARLSYIGSSDTVGLGQSNSHNHMAIHIDNNERVAIGSNHTIPNAVLDVSGSFNVSGSLISRGDSHLNSGSDTFIAVTSDIKMGTDDGMGVDITDAFTVTGGQIVGSIAATNEVISGSAQITALGFVSSSIGDTLQQVTTAGASTNVATTFSNTTDSTSKTTGALIVGGGVGINNTLNVGGDVIAFASSDKRLKDNIKPIEGALDKVSKISGNTFDWNEEKQNTYKGKDYGVIAQEIKDVMPELVDTRDNGYLAVKYDKIVPLLIESIKELKKEIEELKSK